MEWVIIAFFISAMAVSLGYFWKLRAQSQALSSIVTTLGILGTFTGITYGLFFFDPTDIENSMPPLLNGLKIAFVTSIMGIAAAVFLKSVTLNVRRKSVEAQQVSGATIDDLASLLGDIHAAQTKEGDFTRNSLSSIEKALTGEGDTTVVSQLKFLRTEFGDKQNQLLKAFQEFANDMAENNAKALIEALESVMRDFNAKINEQFGDNFKRLNEAVEKILIWQDQYRQQMDELAKEFRLAADSIEGSRTSLETIATHSDRISRNAELLEPILTGLQDSQNSLERNLSAFSELADNAKSAFPTIESRLDDLTKGFSEMVSRNISEAQAAADRHREAIDGHAQKLEKSIEDTHSALRDSLTQQSTDLGRQMSGLMEENANRIAQQVEKLDEALSDELTKSLNSLGSQLASLSEKFVADYTPLTEKLRDVVSIAAKIDNAGR
jgi:DNA anti-recombination protein RmuC